MVTGRLLRLPLRFFDSKGKSEITGRVNKLAEFRRVLTAVSVFAVIDVAFIAIILALITLYSRAIALVVGLTVPVLLALSLITRPFVQRSYRKQSRLQNEYESLISEGVANVATIKMGGLEGWWRSKWDHARSGFMEASQHAKRLAAVENTAVRVTQSLASLLVLWIGTYLALDGKLSPGQLVTCWMFSRRVTGPSARIFRTWQSLQRAWHAEQEVSELVEAQPEQDEGASRLLFPQEPVIRMVEVVFRYSATGPDVINGVTCEIAAGSFVGVMGKSGSGKSTFAKLLQRHLAPCSGDIFIAQTNLQFLDIQSLRSRLQLLTHDAGLFRGSILENLRAGDTEIELQQVINACETCMAHKFVSDLPDAYDTMLDERSSQLSSGQRQRLAMARALLRRPAIILLDEATNALDAETESGVLQHLRNALPQTTLILISHRPAMLEGADKVLVLESGKITERTGIQAHAPSLREVVSTG
jgi:ABC-type bacteriocin/lantibiotic exporter with double-glycine peptidase domain